MDSKPYQRQLILQFLLFLLVLLGLIGLTWANHSYVIHDTGMNEFVSRWAATRWFLLKGMSPYSQQTTNDIQTLVFGGTIENGVEGGKFLFPFFSIFIFTPFALIKDQDIARAIWMSVMEVSVMGVSVLCIMINRWRPSRWIFAFVLLFPLVWYYSVRAILDGNIIILSTFSIALAFLGIRTNHDNLAGFMLALSMVQYQILFPVFLLVLVWAASNKRWPLFWSPIISLVFLLAAPALFMPDWMIQFLRQVINEGFFGITPGAIITYWLPGVGKQTSWILTGSMIGLVLWEWRAVLRKDFRWFLWTACITLVTSFLIGLPFIIEQYVALLPVMILVLAIWDERWGILGRGLVLISFFLMIFGIWFASINAVQRNISPDIDSVLIFFTPLYFLSGLYWVKWKAIRKPLSIKENLGIDLSIL